MLSHGRLKLILEVLVHLRHFVESGIGIPRYSRISKSIEKRQFEATLLR
jgi:hypothetical protein